MDAYTITKTTVWGCSRGFNPITAQKLKVLQCYPFIDHYGTFAFKPKNQRGPARQSQMFIVAHPYAYDDWIGTKEIEFVAMLESIGLRFHKEPFVYRGHSAYRLFIMDTDVELDRIIGVEF